MTDAKLNAGISLLNAVTDLVLLLCLWPFSYRMANVTELTASITTIGCYTALGLPAMFPPGQVTLPSWCGDLTIMGLSVVGVGLQAVRVMSGPCGKVVKVILKGLKSCWKATFGKAADKAEDAQQNVGRSMSQGRGGALGRQSSTIAQANLKGVAEDMFDEAYYPEDAVDDMLEEADDAADDCQVSRKRLPLIASS